MCGVWICMALGPTLCAHDVPSEHATCRYILLPSYRNLLCPCVQPIVHFGFIPVIIVLGMTITEPPPTVAQLLSPI